MVVVASEYPREVYNVQGVTVRMSVREWVEQYMQNNMQRNSFDWSLYQDLSVATLNGGYVYVTSFHFYFCSEDGLLHPIEGIRRNVQQGNVIVSATWFSHSRVRWTLQNLRPVPTWIQGTAILWCTDNVIRDWDSMDHAIPSLRIGYPVADLNTGDWFLWGWRSQFTFLQDGFSMPPHGPNFGMTAFSPFV